MKIFKFGERVIYTDTSSNESHKTFLRGSTFQWQAEARTYRFSECRRERIGLAGYPFRYTTGRGYSGIGFRRHHHHPDQGSIFGMG